jgi:ribosomal-protein-alanine N-acetyltransferase
LIAHQPIGQVIIRRMERKDVSAVYAIDVLSFTLPWSERSYVYDLEKNTAARMWVAEVTDISGSTRVIGMLVMWLIVDEAHIGTLAVHPDFRRMGIGRQLVQIALDEARQAGAAYVYLEVRRSNLAAQSLYREFGFKQVGVRPRYYQDNNEDALLMTLEDW